MAAENGKTKLKSLRVGFYTSSENLRTNNKGTVAAAFQVLFNQCASQMGNAHFAEFAGRDLKIQFLDRDLENGSYFGFISRRRKSANLAYITDEKWLEVKIPFVGNQSLSERTFFLYYPQQDFLVLSLNHLGPRHSDLAFLLFSNSQHATPISFEAIWKEESIKELLETGSSLRSCEISIAIPRNFNAANYNLSGMFANQVINMVSGSSSSHLTISLRGHSPLKKKSTEWLKGDVKASLKELLEKFPSGEGSLEFEKVDVVAQGDRKKKNLVDQVLTVKKSVIIQNDGYPSDSDVKISLIQAKIENDNYLRQYYLTKES
ncbi:hypothetical protein [Rahnella inusitata]|uniref:hypothetical protein n=1 Tax=Rahnella inusitata TaxID=58169 RepID=UPI001BC85715|nr:hypothetical protein [Rahnella inusitata]QUT13502.1 hypothetical protein I2123_12215 [Rahnella inusitata]